MPERGKPTTPPPARIVLLGIRCAFTEPVLHALLQTPGVDIQAVVLPGQSPSPPTLLLDRISELARANGIPLHELSNRAGLHAPAFRAEIEAIAPDLIVVACFPWRIPGWMRALPTCGCLNIHPSLLPDGRGPEPVFWAFRWGLAETGVTLHLVDAGFDTGPIVTQHRLAIPEDATLESLERDLARLSARMLIDRLPALLAGTTVAVPQGNGPARPAPIPGPDDLVVPATWSARHAARFIRAVTPVYGPVPVLVHATGQRLAVHEVVDVDDGATIPEPVRLTGSGADIRFTPGVLGVRLVDRARPLQLHRHQR